MRQGNFPRPAVAAAVFSPDLAQVLLIKRGQPPAQGQWSLPGGVLELGESLAQACAREVREETGIAIAPGGLAKVIERIVPAADGSIAFHYIVLDFWAVVPHCAVPCARSDAAEARWVSLDALGDLATTQGLDEIVARARSLARGIPPETPITEVAL